MQICLFIFVIAKSSQILVIISLLQPENGWCDDLSRFSWSVFEATMQTQQGNSWEPQREPRGNQLGSLSRRDPIGSPLAKISYNADTVG